MWKYKLSCPCGGWGGVILIAATFVFLILDVLIPSANGWAALILLGLFPAALLVAFVVSRIPNQRDREEIDNARMPRWAELTPEHRVTVQMQESCKTDFFLGGIVGGFLMLLGIGFLLSGAEDVVFSCILLLVIGGVMLAVCGLRFLFWYRLPAHVEYTAIPVAYSYNVPRLGKNIRHRDNRVLVFYLPSGKYRLLYTKEDEPEDVYFIRWMGIVHWIHW